MSLRRYYPEKIRQLPTYEGRFEAFQLRAEHCDVLFASYPAGTRIEPHSHDTENVGIITTGQLLLTMDGTTRTISAGEWYHIPAGKTHAAEFDQDTTEIEFWFTD